MLTGAQLLTHVDIADLSYRAFTRYKERAVLHYCDSHCHLTSPELLGQAELLVERAYQAGVTDCVVIATDFSSLQGAFGLQKKVKERRKHWGKEGEGLPPFRLAIAAATTPHDVAEDGESFWPEVIQAAQSRKLAAVGETGLDYHYTHSPRELQREFLKRYLDLALEFDLPVVIHCREAFDDFFQIFDSVKDSSLKGVLHCFTGTLEEAQEVLKRGWYVSFSGIVTFKKNEELRRVAQEVPLDRLLIETDAPYLAPQRHRGKQNEPAYLPEVAEVIAEVKGLSLEKIATATRKNACDLFALERVD